MQTVQPKFKTVDEYIAYFPSDIAEKLKSIRSTILKAFPDVKEKISYNMPGYHHHGILIYFAAWKKHISLYPISSEMEKNIEEISNFYTSGKGTLQFPISEPVPLSLVKKIVEYRAKDNMSRKKHPLRQKQI